MFYKKAYNYLSKKGYSYSDRIYHHLNFALVYEQQNNIKARSHFLKAALLWLVWDNPYSIGWRVKLILNNKLKNNFHDPIDINIANNFFIEKLTPFINNSIKTSHHHFNILKNNSNLVKPFCTVNDCGVFYFSNEKITYEIKKENQDLHELACLLINSWDFTGSYNSVYVENLTTEFVPTVSQIETLINNNNGTRTFYYGRRLNELSNTIV